MREIHGKLVYNTLREIINPKHTALLVVDVQNDTCTEGGHASRTPGKESLVPKNRELIPSWVRFVDKAREAGVFIDPVPRRIHGIATTRRGLAQSLPRTLHHR